MSALVSAFGQAARAAAKALENAGRLLEVSPYVEHRTWYYWMAGRSICLCSVCRDRIAIPTDGAVMKLNPPIHLPIHTVTPSTKVVKHAGKAPAIHASAFVAPTANVIGQVTIGQGSSVWYGATLRGAFACHTTGGYTLFA